MKGLLFAGCSFTWGQGLYYYSNLNRLVYPPNEFTYKRQDLNDAHIRFKDVIRYPRLVSNHFNTFEIFKNVNGGGEDESFEFLHYVFDMDKPKQDHFLHEKFYYDDIEYIVIQTSQIWRNRFYFTLDGVEDFAFVSSNSNGGSYNWEKLFDWMTKENVSYDELLERHFKCQYERFLKEIKFFESKGIKIKILCWEREMYDIIKDDEYLMNKFVRLDYNDKIYNTIWEMQHENPHLKIKFDYGHFGDNPPDDHHPSKECHRVIADNLIKSIEKDTI